MESFVTTSLVTVIFLIGVAWYLGVLGFLYLIWREVKRIRVRLGPAAEPVPPSAIE